MNNDKRFLYKLGLQIQFVALWALLLLMTAVPALYVFGGIWWVPVVILLATVLVAQGSAAVPYRVFADERLLGPQTSPELYDMVAGLAGRAGLRNMPELRYLPRPTINAAATGSEYRPRIILTAGLLEQLDARSVRAVMAHEIAHIAHRDLDTFRSSAFFRAAITGLSLTGLLLSGMIVSDPLWFALFLSLPVLSLGVVYAISRNREYAADLMASELTGDPQALANALYLIEYRQRPLWSWVLGIPPARDDSLFRTHPPTEERIRRLMGLKAARPMGSRAYLH